MGSRTATLNPEAACSTVLSEISQLLLLGSAVMGEEKAGGERWVFACSFDFSSEFRCTVYGCSGWNAASAPWPSPGC